MDAFTLGAALAMLGNAAQSANAAAGQATQAADAANSAAAAAGQAAADISEGEKFEDRVALNMAYMELMAKVRQLENRMELAEAALVSIQ